MRKSRENCTLLFSGGRDSTLAALRLRDSYRTLTLVTATSDHLVGAKAVRRRLHELAPLLPPASKWLRVRQPPTANARSFSAPTCLPCHAAYAALGVAVAREEHAQAIAFGYAGYQSDWPEQTPFAIATLRAVLEEQGVALEVPVYDLSAKGAAIDELAFHGLSTLALEQKCTQQQYNVELSPIALHDEIGLWGTSIRATIANVLRHPLEIIEHVSVQELR